MTLAQPLLRRVIAASAFAWVVALVGVVFLAGRLSGPAASVPAFVYVAGSLVCHQQPERSFHIAAVQFPVCARCLGLYVGAAVAALAAAAAGDRLAPMSPRSARIVFAVAAAPTVATLAAEWATGMVPSNAVRAAAGVPLGAAAAALISRLR